MTLKSPSRLARCYDFFNTVGAARLDGLNESYFVGLTKEEKETAWIFLQENFTRSSDRIKGMYILDASRAVNEFKKAIAIPIDQVKFIEEQKQLESSRLSMLKYVNLLEPDERWLAAMCDFAFSNFAEIRGEFARALPARRIALAAVSALKKMIFTEVERVPLASAITKLMLIHGMDFDMDDPVYDSIYRLLQSQNKSDKLSAFKRLESIHAPDFIVPNA
jgi:hypothetical protein